MRKVLALIVIASAFTFTACGGKKVEEHTETTVDSVSTAAPADTVVATDSAAVTTDSSAHHADTTHKM